MKNLLIILLIILAFSCRSTKKLTESSNVNSQKTEVAQSEVSSDTKKVANDKDVTTTTTTTETNFFPPDTTKSKTGTTVDSKDKGPIKSIKTTVTTTKKTDKGVTIATNNQEVKTNVAKQDDNKTESKVTEKKTVPIQWGWIFGILLLLVGVFIYLKRSMVFAWFKSVLSPAGKISKI